MVFTFKSVIAKTVGPSVLACRNLEGPTEHWLLSVLMTDRLTIVNSYLGNLVISITVMWMLVHT